MKVLVTGASGFVGSAIVAELLQHGHDVRIAVRRLEQAARFERASSAVIGDLSQPIDWSRHLDGIDALVHAAGLAHARTKTASQQLFAVNVEATDRLMRTAKRAGVATAVHISSVRAVVGTSCDDIVGEDRRPEPTNDYGRSKLESEKAVAASGLSGAILRPPLVHGAHVRGNLALLARVAASPLPLPLGGLNARRSIVSDRNLAAAAAFLVARPGTDLITALVADPVPLSASEIVTKLRAGIGRGPNLFGAARLLSPLLAALRQDQLWQSLAGRLELAPSRLGALGWEPVESSDAGLARTMKSIGA